MWGGPFISISPRCCIFLEDKPGGDCGIVTQRRLTKDVALRGV